MLKGPYHSQKKGRGWYWLLLFVIVGVTMGFFSKGLVPTKSHAQKPQAPQKPLPKQVVVIDPGHGGSDPGACRAGVLEKDLNLAIAKHMAKHLPNLQVVLTRTADQDFVENGVYSKAAERQDLARRIEVARQANAQVFVSIHINTGEGQDQGALIYYDPTDQESSRLAKLMQVEVNQLPDTTAKKPRPERFYLFDNLQIPVVLVEAGWLCNPMERTRLQNAQYQEQMAAAISRGITEFLEKKE